VSAHHGLNCDIASQKIRLTVNDQNIHQPQPQNYIKNKSLTNQIIKNTYRVAQNKISHQTIRNISATSGLILKIIEAA